MALLSDVIRDMKATLLSGLLGLLCGISGNTLATDYLCTQYGRSEHGIELVIHYYGVASTEPESLRTSHPEQSREGLQQILAGYLQLSENEGLYCHHTPIPQGRGKSVDAHGQQMLNETLVALARHTRHWNATESYPYTLEVIDYSAALVNAAMAARGYKDAHSSGLSNQLRLGIFIPLLVASHTLALMSGNSVYLVAAGAIDLSLFLTALAQFDLTAPMCKLAEYITDAYCMPLSRDIVYERLLLARSSRATL